MGFKSNWILRNEIDQMDQVKFNDQINLSLIIKWGLNWIDFGLKLMNFLYSHFWPKFGHIEWIKPNALG